MKKEHFIIGLFSTLVIATLVVFGVQKMTTNAQETILGCTNPIASNYNPMANQDDGSCIILGCTNSLASNYSAMATQDDGSCIIPGCTNSIASNYNPAANQDDGSCIILGCTDALANNYNMDANQDDGSCTYTIPGCTDALALNYNPAANQDDGSCAYLNWVSIYTSEIYPTLSAGGIINNFDQVTNQNINTFMPSFENVRYGKIEFLTGLDLESTDVQTFLQNLPTYISMEDGYISFNPIAGGERFNVPANISMYFENLPFIGTGSADNIIVRDSEGNLLANDMLSDVTCADGICSFQTDHFTSFEFDDFSCDAVTDISVAECESLVELYQETDGDNWTTKTNWLGKRNADLTPNTVCDWYGVTCNGAEIQSVLQITLESNNLVGEVPEEISAFTNLTTLNLSQNKIISLPNNIGNLINIIQIDVHNNQITSLPESISNIPNVNYLNIPNNALTTLPESLLLMEGSYMYSSQNLYVSDNCINQNSLSVDLRDFVDWAIGSEWGTQDLNCPSDNVMTTDNVSDGTDDVYIYDHSSTGSTEFTDDNTLTITSSDDANDYIEFDTLGFTIEVIDGTRDGLLYSPTETTDPDLSDLPSSSNTRTILMTVEAGAIGASLSAVGGNFTVSFVVPDGAIGDVLNIYRSEDGITWVANTPDATCTLDSDKVCKFDTDHLSSFSSVKETTKSSGGSPIPNVQDTCPNGDNSPSYYDGICEEQIDENMIHGAAELDAIVGSPYAAEMNNAYLYAFQMGITTIPSIQKANINGGLSRADMARMLAIYSAKVLGKKLDTSLKCEFKDLKGQSKVTRQYIKYACQLGLMGYMPDGTVSSLFNPTMPVTRADLGTVLSRTLYGKDKYAAHGSAPYYKDHLDALKKAGIIKDITPSYKETIGNLMLMLKRAAK